MTQRTLSAVSLFRCYFGDEATECSAVQSTDGKKTVLKIKSEKHSAAALLFSSKKEAEVFSYITDIFIKSGVRVPEIYFSDREKNILLCEDAGEESLFVKTSSLSETTERHIFMSLFTKALDFLRLMQTEVAKRIDYSKCWPVRQFCRKSVSWDLDYFKYCFLRLLNISFDESSLDKDFIRLSSLFMKIPQEFFVHRDFQSRNLFLKNGELLVIDYAGGRKGPMQYDATSLIHQTRAAISKEEREKLIDYYVKIAESELMDKPSFVREGFLVCALLRLLQNLGAYGLRGFHEQKTRFKNCVIQAIENALGIIDELDKKSFPHITEALKKSRNAAFLLVPSTVEGSLTVRIKSFSYKKGIPRDLSVHGGGFVFDCRHLSNPGRISRLAHLSGKDPLIAHFIEKDPRFDLFMGNVREIIHSAVENYLERGFEHLDVFFGCTGGRHRSVFCAEKLKESLLEKKELKVQLFHSEEEA
ncbi:hypothetical protein JW890_00185 [candidate division WOR-3 bacterium]|nr:hypothetical protein [candidate division WOR-3 bacterium]